MRIGIDLGTSYSSVAAEIEGKIEMIKISTGASAFGDSFSMPTAVYIDNGQVLLGQAALSKRKISPSCFKSEFKRDLGTTTPYILSGEEYLPEQLYTEIFLYFKEQAVKQTGEKIEKLYLTHPANYGNSKKRLIEKAANNAGFFDIVLVDEPTAAAAGYSQKNKIVNGDILLVYDLGGGTFDVALIKKTAKGYVHLTEPLGISQCGGVDFDRVIFEDVIRKMGQKGEFDIERLLKERRFTAALSETSIQIKHQLSQAQSHTEPIAVGAYDYFEYTITRQEFEDMIKALVLNTCEKVKDILKNSGLMGSDIDKVLLVGGSSRVPLVQKMVTDTLQKDICFDADPELAVCQGAVSLGIMVQEAAKDKKEEPEQKIKIENEKKYDIEPEAIVKEKGNEKEKGKTEDERQKLDVIPQNAEAANNNGNMHKLMSGALLGSYALDGEWIYYVDPNDDYKLYKIKKNGTLKTKLSNFNSKPPIKIENEWIYYQVKVGKENRKYNFYRIKKDGTEETKISDMLIFCNGFKPDFELKDGWIYFVDERQSLRKMHADGSCSTPITSDTGIYNLTMYKDQIYFWNYDNAYKVGLDGEKRVMICSCSDLIENISVYNGLVLYNSFQQKKILFTEIWTYKLWKVNDDGTGNRKVLDNFRIDGMKIIDGLLYYLNVKGEEIYSMKLDGTDVRHVSPEMLREMIMTAKV